MRYYFVPPAVKKERERLRKLAKKKREQEKAAQKRKEKREKEKIRKKEKEKREKEKLKEKKRLATKKRALAKRRKKYAIKHADEIAERKRIKKAKEAAKRKEKKQVAKLREKEREKTKKEKARAIHREKVLKATPRRKHREYMRRTAKKRKSEHNRKYYEEVRRPRMLKERLENGDKYGYYRIIITKDLVKKKTVARKTWFNDITDIFNKAVEENHATVKCPMDELTNSRKTNRPTKQEILLIRRIDKDMENNETFVRDENGRVIKIMTDSEDWVIVRKEPWYVEEKFTVGSLTGTVNERKKTCPWIAENIIDKLLSQDDTVKIIMWNMFVIFESENNFEFVFGKTERAAMNLYKALFKIYENSKRVYFFGTLSPELSSRVTDKIKEKTGWKNLKRGKCTYYNKRNLA